MVYSQSRHWTYNILYYLKPVLAARLQWIYNILYYLKPVLAARLQIDSSTTIKKSLSKKVQNVQKSTKFIGHFHKA
jgi:hypothetical protein